HARAAHGGELLSLQWVGKFFEDDGAARRVAAVLRELAASDCGARGEMEVPRVLGYDAPRRLLLLTYEAGESVVSAIAHQRGPVVPVIGRALAALHGTPVSLEAITCPADVLNDLRPRVTELCARFPGEADVLRDMLFRLEHAAPSAPAAPSFLHGDFGTANLLWRPGRLVVLDFDRCTRGDPALDLGYLLTQLRRVTLRKPGKLPEFASLSSAILEAYQRWSPPDAALASRVAWYEQATLVGKIHVLTFDLARHQEAGAERQDKVRLVVAASGGILLIALGSGVFSCAQIFLTSSIGYRMLYALRRELFAHLQTLSLAFHNQSRSGDLLTKIAGDTNPLKDLFAD